MRVFFLPLAALIVLLTHPVSGGWVASARPQAENGTTVMIESPVAGEAVQGSVTIRGSTASDGFRSYEVSFAYAEDSTNTWFIIQEGATPMLNGILAVWDTTTITDGIYTIRVIVVNNDETSNEVLINRLRVRNYSPIETDTPTPVPPVIALTPTMVTLTPISISTSTPYLTAEPPTFTSLPTNPAEISSFQAMLTLGKGAGVTIVLFAILGIYLGMRALLHKNR